jgi:uncharacterized GH25 family protein
MKKTMIVLAILLVSIVTRHRVFAHFTILIPSSTSAKKSETVSVIFQWGHPFEHQIFDAQPPAETLLLSPDGKLARLQSEETALPDGDKKHRAYRFQFAAAERGDYLLFTKSQPTWMEEEQEFLVDYAKVVVHVQAQKGWDRSFTVLGTNSAGTELVEAVPLTRPYGLQPGMAFQTRIFADGKSAADVPVEIERYNREPPKELPADEQITHTAKTDPNGVVTCTLSEPGWWCIAARCAGGTAERNGKKFPVQRRAILWLFVDEKPTASSNK